MTRKQVVHFTGSGPAWPASYIGFYSDSGATTPVTVYSDQIAGVVLASGKTGSSPVRKLRADNLGAVPPPALGIGLYVDSAVTTLYARPETATGVAVSGAAAVSVASYGPDGPVTPPDPSSNDPASKMPLLATTAWTSGPLNLGVNTVDATAGAKTPALPVPSMVGQLCSVEKTDASTNTVTVSGTIRGSAGTLVLTSQFQSIVLEAESLSSWRPIADHRTAAALSATYALKSDVVVSTTGTGSTDTAAVQAAITANPGRTIRLVGVDTTFTTTVTIQTDKTALIVDCGVTAAFTGGPMVRVLNAAYNKVLTRFFDGNWQTGVVGIELMGALLGEFDLIGDRMPVGMNLDCANAAATQNSALNTLRLTVRNGIKGFAFTGKSGQFASDNVIQRMRWWGPSSAVGTGIDFAKYSDNNRIENAYINLNFAGSIGVVYNSDTPASDMQVYENHFDGIVEAQVTGTTAIKGNQTYQSLGQFPTYVRLRSSGAQTPALDIAANSDIVHVNSNLNGVPAGLTGIDEVTVWAKAMGTGFSATTGQATDLSWVGLADAQTTMYGFGQCHVPVEWRAYSVIVEWGLAGSAGGNVKFTTNVAQIAAGGGPSAGTAYTVTAAGAAQDVRVSSTVATGVARTGGLTTVRVTRVGTDAADTATDVMHVYAVRLLRTS